MIIEIDSDSPVPPYEQIRAQVETLVATGQLAVGARMPTIRQLAGDLGIAPGTVARAYRELEAQGVVRSRVRHGTVVAPRPETTADDSADLLASAAREYAVTARSLGIAPDQALAVVRRLLAS